MRGFSRNVLGGGGGGSGSVTSTELSNTTSIANTASNAASVVSAAAADLSSRVSILSQAVSVLSNMRSSLKGGTTGQVLKKSSNTDYDWNWSTDQTGGAGSAGVTSNAISVLSQGISVLSQGHSTLSQDHSVLSQAHSALSQAVSVMSTTLSNLGSVVTVGQSNSLSVLSQQASVISQQVSVLSQAHSALSQVVSVMSTTLSNLGSVVTVAQSNTLSVLSQAISVISQQVSTISQSLSTVVSGASVRSVGNVSTHGHQSILNALSNRVSAAAGGSASPTSNEHSIVSHRVSVMYSGVSVRNTAAASIHGTQSILDAFSNRISAGGGGAGSVTSTEASAISAQALSALNVTSNNLSALSSNLIPTQMRVLSSSDFTISATGLTNISGLSISVAASAAYHVEGRVIYKIDTANAVGFGVTFPALVNGAATFIGPTSVAPTNASSFSTLALGVVKEDGSGSIIYSVLATSTNRTMNFDGIFFVSNVAGTVQLQGRTSVATAQLIVAKGSYIRAFRVV